MKIKRCPFCSKTAKIIDTSQQLIDNNKYYDIACGTKGCFLEFGAGYSFETKEEVIKIWNRRKK